MVVAVATGLSNISTSSMASANQLLSWKVSKILSAKRGSLLLPFSSAESDQ
jgi:hypothetical protein